ncbi:MAG: aminoacyl-tRNA hydrolase [Firmicutes bacterium]|nr:aminoacyl-tRNA hydrolase [Bacillota bacterium]
MKLIVGLGNIGKEYQQTRHNIGFMFLDYLKDDWGLEFKEEKAFKGYIASKVIDGVKTYFLMPTTYMNLSGESVQVLSSYYKIEIEDILVIYDDMDLPVGESRYKKKGSSGGQKGMGDIIQKLGTDKISRLKVGIGKGQGYLTGKDYVLSKFDSEESIIIREQIKEQEEGVRLFIKSGIEKTMNEMNRKKNEQKEQDNQGNN